ncbi:MAG: cell division protease FtsH [Frankiaceae bacterium]|nr:cell division protease FtsH [Frankiaceae bacterium]
MALSSSEMLSAVGAGGLLETHLADVGSSRERTRSRRLLTVGLWLALPTAYLWNRLLHGNPVNFLNLSFPHIDWLVVAPLLFFVLLGVVLIGSQVGAGRSPHITFRPEQIDVRLADVRGIDMVKEDVIRSMNLFLAHKQFSQEMGGTPRRGLLFEGAPGTGKTYLAKAMAAEAGVPFLFVSGTSFQSMFYGATAKKIRSYFKELRKTAQREGGAIGFIEEIDAIAQARGGMSATAMPESARMDAHLCCGGLEGLPSSYASTGLISSPSAISSEGSSGVVNELLVQMQSFDEPTGSAKTWGKLVDKLNLLLPAHRQIQKKKPERANVLLIAATNRADALDPALLRPGRFDRKMTFELPTKAGRRELIDHFLARKAHSFELDDPERRDALAAVTTGFSPVMIEHICDEGLVNALRRGDTKMSWKDIEHARLTEQVGMGQPVAYTAYEERLIATHEAGHATAAYLVAPHRRLEVLTIIKRRSALGLLAHGDQDDVFTRSRSEMLALIQVALAGQCAEELFFGDVSTGPGGDLLYATNVAAEMVGSCGMVDSLISYGAVQQGALGGSNLAGRVLGDSRGREAVANLLNEQKVIIRAKLEESMHMVAALRDALIDRHELIGHEITDVLRSAKPTPAVIDLRDPEPTAPATTESAAERA